MRDLGGGGGEQRGQDVVSSHNRTGCGLHTGAQHERMVSFNEIRVLSNEFCNERL